jgi:hypothetical protein
MHGRDKRKRNGRLGQLGQKKREKLEIHGLMRDGKEWEQHEGFISMAVTQYGWSKRLYSDLLD